MMFYKNRNDNGKKAFGKRFSAALLLLCLAVRLMFGNSITVNAAEQPQPVALLLFTWNGIGESGSLMTLDLGVSGTLNSGAGVSISENGSIVAEDGTLVGGIAVADGQILVSLYRTDGNFSLKLANGDDWIDYGINNIRESGAAVLALLPGQELQSVVLAEDRLYRSYTGLWYYGMGLNQGMLAEYEGQ